MNQTNSTTLGASSSTSISAYIERYVITGLNAGVSFFGVLANLAVVLVICRHPQLRQNCKYLQAALAAGDVIACLGQLMNSAISIISAITGASLKLVRWKCLLLTSVNVFGIIYSTCMTVFIALDRCYAIFFPVRYWTLKKSRVCAVCATTALLVTGSCTAATFCDVNLYDFPSGCIGSSSRSPRLAFLINYFATTAGSVVLVVYPITMIVMRAKMRHITKDMSITNQKSSCLRKQVEATTSISYVIVAGLILYMIPSSVVLILSALKLQLGNARSYVGLSSSIHSSINCLFYVWKEPKMRRQLKRTFCCDMTSVTPFPINAPVT